MYSKLGLAALLNNDLTFLCNMKNERYYLSLLNTDPTLDLSKKQKYIEKAFDIILSGGKNGDKYKNIMKINLVSIGQRGMLIDVTESDKVWHMILGHILKIHFNMEEFCYADAKNGQDIMFQWN